MTVCLYESLSYFRPTLSSLSITNSDVTFTELIWNTDMYSVVDPGFSGGREGVEGTLPKFQAQKAISIIFHFLHNLLAHPLLRLPMDPPLI